MYAAGWSGCLLLSAALDGPPAALHGMLADLPVLCSSAPPSWHACSGIDLSPTPSPPPQANKAAVGAVFEFQLAQQRVCSDAEAEAAVAAAVQRVLDGELL